METARGLGEAARRTAATVGRWVLDAALPRRCPGCLEEIAGRRWICGRCRRGFRAAPSRPLCVTCRAESRSGSGREAGLGCDRADHAWGWGWAAFWMEPPLDAVIHAFKYGGRDALGRPLGRLLAREVRPGEEGLVLGVPLHRTRRRERGYNQAEVLGRWAARTWNLPVLDGVLERGRSTRPQARLDAAGRERNVAGAFRLREPGLVRGRNWILVDDVATTGSTLRSAMESLAAAGASRVVPVVLALA